MKKYIKPKSVLIDLDAEELLAGSPDILNGYEEGDGLAKRNSIVTDDEYLGSDFSHVGSAVENSDDAMIFNR